MSNIWIDISYIKRIASSLDKFQQKGRDLFTFRCPLCGDSKKNKNKTRGYFYPEKGSMRMKCHNCGAGMSFSDFLKHTDHILHKEFALEHWKEKSNFKPVAEVVDEKKFTTNTKFCTNIFRSLENISSLSNDHSAKKYLMERKIPVAFLDELWYSPQFKKFTNNLLPETYKEFKRDEERIIIPLRDETGKVFGYQGRLIGGGDNGLRYITIRLNEDKPKIYGLDKVDQINRKLVVEGPFDSMFLENCVAMVGSDVPLEFFDKGDVFIFDNEPRSKEIVDKIAKVITKGYHVVIWPESLMENDINDMVLSGRDVQKLVDGSIYNGLNAMAKFLKWRKVR